MIRNGGLFGNENSVRIAKKLLWTLVFGAIAVLAVTPFIWMISASLKRPADVMTFPVQWLPDELFLKNYITILGLSPGVTTMYANSALITGVNVLGSLIVSSLAAYALTKMRFPGRTFFLLLILGTFMIPPQSTYVARFVLFSWLRIVNTRWALILPGMYAGVGTFLLRQYFMQIPDALVESAKIDGASHLTIWARIIMPVARPMIATFVILVFTHHWNDYETPLIFIRNPELYTLPLGLVSYADETGVFYHLQMALMTMATLPLLIVFVIAQKQFVQGITAGALKQ